MLTKLLFTAAVIAAVYAIFRLRSRAPVVAEAATGAQHKPLGAWAAYAFVALLIGVSAVFYYFHWHDQHRIVTIRVTDGRTGVETTYRAYHKSIQGDRFESLDGTIVRLGADERVEMTATH